MKISGWKEATLGRMMALTSSETERLFALTWMGKEIDKLEIIRRKTVHIITA